MVGVPRSTGCARCVQRRVKCDEGRPGCGNCSKYGAHCPGYVRGNKFVSGKHTIRARRSPGEQGLDVNTLLWIDAADAATNGKANGTRTSVKDVDDVQLLPPAGTDYGRAIQVSTASRDEAFTVLIPAALKDDRASFVGTMIDSLQRTMPAMEIGIFSPLFKGSPAYLGRKVTLDSAMCAFTLHLLAKSKGNLGLVGDSRRLYGQSLAVLQQALLHPTEWKSPETLATVMILCFYEVSVLNLIFVVGCHIDTLDSFSRIRQGDNQRVGCSTQRVSARLFRKGASRRTQMRGIGCYSSPSAHSSYVPLLISLTQTSTTNRPPDHVLLLHLPRLLPRQAPLAKNNARPHRRRDQPQRRAQARPPGIESVPGQSRQDTRHCMAWLRPP